MFASLREKFFNVQEEITSSLRNLKLDRQISRDSKRKSEICNYDAGLELLERYQSYWTDIHSKTEITALCAAEVDEIIQSLHESYEGQWKKVGKLSTSLALIPQVTHGVQEICDAILNLQCAFDETEDALLMLEDMIETQELREKQLENRFQIYIYQEKRISELDILKETLAEEHLRKIKEYEKKREPTLKERQAVFQEAFENDVQQYKLQGTIPKVTSSADSTPSLEEIQLEDPLDELESFLADEDLESDPNQQKDSLPVESNGESSTGNEKVNANDGMEESTSHG